MKTATYNRFFSFLALVALGSAVVAQPSITSFAPAAVSAGTKTVLTITGTGFGTGGPSGTKYVDFGNGDDGGVTWVQPIPSEYVSWTNTQIQVEVPSDAGTGNIRVTNSSTTTSGASLGVTFAYLNVTSGGLTYQPDHIDEDASGGYTWQMFTDFDANAAANASFLRALETWRCATYINWDVGSVTAVDVVASDGVNVVRMDNGGELPAGVLGRCTSRWTACNPGTWEWWVFELDIVFDETPTGGWDFTAPASCANMEFEAVALHELGHGHQLGHVINPADVMHYAVGCGPGTITLTANNVAGGNAVMSNSTAANGCPESPMVSLTAGNCPLACAGNAPSNDNICSSTVLVPGGACLTAESNNCSTDQGFAFGCGTGIKTVWYSVTLTGANDILDITFASATFGTDVELYLYNGACGGPTQISTAAPLPSQEYLPEHRHICWVSEHLLQELEALIFVQCSLLTHVEHPLPMTLFAVPPSYRMGDVFPS